MITVLTGLDMEGRLIVYLDADDVYFRSDSGATNHVDKKKAR